MESKAAVEEPSRGQLVVCLGEAIVDVLADELPKEIDESREGGLEAERLGGSIANVAVGARRFGARSKLLGGAGDDRRGRFLLAALEREGVDVSDFRLVDGVTTSAAIVTLDHAGEPSYDFTGEPIEPLLTARSRLGDVLDPAEPGLLVVGSDTLVDEPVRELTREAVVLAGERGWRVLYDPNLRPNRWPDTATMLDVIGGLIGSAWAVKLNLDEARELSGEAEPADAAAALLERGPELVVVTCGGDGLVGRWRGEDAIRVEIEPARVRDATGAGDSVTSVLAAASALGSPRQALAPVLRAAGETARGVVSVFGALDGLPARGWPGWPERRSA
ncbi:hypothetical protein HJD18_14980 [Thermoleophilia bacterium SCSIO 60948]|nr:hypothetical protein HJD18_14980 [Thermoleophilia bacterium SCSIO 60948]